jgi:hypothetical protein
MTTGAWPNRILSKRAPKSAHIKIGFGGIQVTVGREMMLGAPDRCKTGLLGNLSLVTKHSHNLVSRNVFTWVKERIKIETHLLSAPRIMLQDS